MENAEKRKSLMSIPVIFEATSQPETVDNDPRFTRVKVWLMHLGQNQNGSVFDKSVVDTALPTLSYIPIVGFIEQNKLGDNDFSDHRYIITRDVNGRKMKYIGCGYGVITSSADNNAHYEDRLCDDGETRTFLVVDGLMWNMFEDSSDIIKRDLIKSHSMELWDDEDSVDGYIDDDGLFHFTKFSFRAACILGDHKEPAMMNSTVEVQFSMKDFMNDIHQELFNKYTEFTKLVDEQNQGGTEPMGNTNFQTVMNQFEDISNVVRQYETVEDRWGDKIPRYYLQDIQEDEVIVVDRQSSYQLYGFKYSVTGDKPTINFSEGKRKKIEYTDYVEGASEIEGAFDFGKHISERESVAAAKVDDLQVKYEKVKTELDQIKPDYEKYVQAEADRKAEEINAKKDSEFAKYEEELADNAEFVDLKAKKEALSFEEIESECALIFAKKKLSQKAFSKNTPSVTLDIPDSGKDGNEGVVTKYGLIKPGV